MNNRAKHELGERADGLKLRLSFIHRVGHNKQLIQLKLSKLFKKDF